MSKVINILGVDYEVINDNYTSKSRTTPHYLIKYNGIICITHPNTRYVVKNEHITLKPEFSLEPLENLNGIINDIKIIDNNEEYKVLVLKLTFKFGLYHGVEDLYTSEFISEESIRRLKIKQILG